MKQVLFNFYTIVQLAFTVARNGEYLYDGDKAAYPVVEYTKKTSAKEKDPLRPDFLYEESEKYGYRVVEFYSPMCPHCIHYKPHYIKLVNELVEKASVPVSIHAVSCITFKEICVAQNVHGYPTVKYFAKGSIEGGVFNRNENSDALLKLLNIEAKKEDAKMVEKSVQPKAELHPKEIKPPSESYVTPLNVKHYVDLYHDAELSFYFNMKTGIFMEAGALSHEKEKTFKAWITLMQRTWPKSIGNVQAFTQEIEQNFEKVVESEEALHAVLAKYSYVKEEDWSDSCKKGQSYAGYTCGLWSLFHIMSIGLMEWNTSVKDQTEKIITTADAADTLRDFVAHFFACSVCQAHFIKMYDSCSFDRCNRLHHDVSATGPDDWKQYVLWLWETHNDVNMRLKGEEKEREGVIVSQEEKKAARFPSKAECPTCWTKLAAKEWSDEAILVYLREYYWPGGQYLSSVQQKSKRQINQSQPFISNIAQLQNFRPSSSLQSTSLSNYYKLSFHSYLTFLFFLPVACIFASRRNRNRSVNRYSFLKKKNSERTVFFPRMKRSIAKSASMNGKIKRRISIDNNSSSSTRINVDSRVRFDNTVHANDVIKI